MIASLGLPLTIALWTIAVLAGGGIGTAIVAFLKFWIEAGQRADDLAEPGQHPQARPGEWPPPDPDDQWHAQISAMPHVRAHNPDLAKPYQERIMTPEEKRWEMQRRSWEIHMDALIGGTWWRTGNATG